ncbi:uncharacterized protein FOMMEDRAFT_31417 [Fomitiporia mediterranea MF3/22]|uniref:uncharacterized protein n=1 Tax=Fomitiporia mediterranea (strain MF3/22) TaxID=694068 RepID=UPI0004409960|nr:uncharacterized protein FOMMEDRAFT_31417 [Fomitiporia mediterranea MF3/22]EJC99375.1 hypothetical protein FOMMEDRAFT_31417 [Fomitiporia mediterranea MF3/22]
MHTSTLLYIESNIKIQNLCIGLLGAICSIVSSTFNQSELSCQATTWISLLYIVLIDYILQIRVLALYQNNKKLSFYLKILLIIEGGTSLGIPIYIYWNQDIYRTELLKGIKIL